MQTLSTDVAVVGAGLSGLTAAKALTNAGADVLVLEASSRVGGRTLTREVHGSTIDLGGQWIGPSQRRMHALVQELGLHTFPTPTGGQQVLDLAGRVRCYGGTIPKLGLLDLAQLQLLLTLVERARRQVSPVAPWSHEQASFWDSQTVESWAKSHIPSSSVRALLRPTVRVVFGAEPGELSMLHFLMYVASADGLMPLIEVQQGFQQDRIVEGAQAVSKRLAERLGRNKIHCESPVTAIEQDRRRVVIHTPRARVRAARVIVAAPLALLQRIHFSPGLPPLREQLHQRVPMGQTVKFFAAYDRPFWRERGLSGEAVCTDGPISVTFDNTTPDQTPMLLAFITGNPARLWHERPAPMRRQEILGHLCRWFGQEAQHPRWTFAQDWSTETWTRGGPISLFPPGTLSISGKTLRQPVGRIHWAGTETARHCTGFMEGAVEAGERSAEEVCHLGSWHEST